MIRSCFPRRLSLFILMSAISVAAIAQPISFTRTEQNVEGSTPVITSKEAARYERFLSAVFPTRPMKRFAHESETPVVRRVTYTVVEQRHEKFILVAFTGRWKEAVNVIGLYRVTRGPIQVWRSVPWYATYYDLHFTTADVGSRTVALFQEGGEDHHFGLAGLFAFARAKNGITLQDVTPASTLLRVRTRFPFRPILAQDIQLSREDEGKPALVLSASDREYVLAGGGHVRPSNHWKFDRTRNRFVPVKPASTWRPEITTFRAPGR